MPCSNGALKHQAQHSLLTQQLHPFMILKIQNKFCSLKRDGSQKCAFQAPLLFTTAANQICTTFLKRKQTRSNDQETSNCFIHNNQWNHRKWFRQTRTSLRMMSATV